MTSFKNADAGVIVDQLIKTIQKERDYLSEIDGKIVVFCVCVIIFNLIRNVREYEFVDNVVSHGEYRKKGYATD